ncbi:MAG: GNAT family N-acetyltransferase [Terriglobales bacterium]
MSRDTKSVVRPQAEGQNPAAMHNQVNASAFDAASPRDADFLAPQAAGATTDVAPAEARPCAVEVATSGRWHSVPALVAGGTAVFLRGRWLRIGVVRDEDFAAEAVADPGRWVAALRRYRVAGRRADMFAFSQRLPDTEPRFDYPFERVSMAALRLETFETWWTQLPQETRKNVRRAERRGVEVRVQKLDRELVRGIQAVNDECPVVQGKKSRFHGRSLPEVWKDHESFSDRSWWVCAYHGGELVGYMKIVHCGAFASVLTTLTRPSHADKRPANAILARVVRLCLEEGIPSLVYGQLNYGNKREGSLREFKLRNGFSEILVPRYYVPLTLRGRIALRLGLHRGLLGALPPWAIRAALHGRDRWRRLRAGDRGHRAALPAGPAAAGDRDG